MNAEQLTQLFQNLNTNFATLVNTTKEARGASSKIPSLSSTDPTEFKIFRENFQLIAAANEWGVQRSKQICKAALNGEAALILHDIDLGAHEGDHVLTLEGLLDAYENRIIAPAASAAAEIEFEACRQLPSENILTFHTRARRLFLRAFPNTTAADLDNSRTLIHKFISGLSSAETQRYVFRSNPASFTEALNLAAADEMSQLAVNHAAAKLEKRVAAMTPISDNQPEMNAIGDAGKPNSPRKCYFPLCESTEHFVRECPKRKMAYQYFNRRGNGRSSRGNTNRGRGKNWSKSGKSSNRKMFLMEEVELAESELTDVESECESSESKN